MKTKTLIVGLMALLLFSIFSVTVMAEEKVILDANESLISELNGTVDEATNADINDDLNGSAGTGAIFREKLKLWFTFNQEKKAEIELKIARLELIRARIAAQNNNTVAMEKAFEAHNRILERVKVRINSIDGETTKQKIKDSAEKLIGLERAIQVHEARIAKLNEILSSANLTEEQMSKVQDKIEQAENNIAHLKEVEAAKIEKVKTRLMVAVNMTKNEADAEIKKLENAQNMSAVRNMVKEVKTVRTEKAAESISKVIEKLETKQVEGKNLSVAISKLTNVQQKLETRAENLRARV